MPCAILQIIMFKESGCFLPHPIEPKVEMHVEENVFPNRWLQRLLEIKLWLRSAYGSLSLTFRISVQNYCAIVLEKVAGEAEVPLLPQWERPF